jgi:hypothetical protein
MLPGAMELQTKQVGTPSTISTSHQGELLSPRPHGGIRRFFKGGTVAGMAQEAALPAKFDPTALATFTTHKMISANTRQTFSAERKSVALSEV